MGWDIVALGNHKLDTSNLETLAKQVSDAYNINVVYGHLNIVKYNDDLHCVEYPNDYNYHKIGKISKAKNRKLYHLIDEYYNEKIIYNKFEGNLENIVYAEFEDEFDREFCENEIMKGFEFLSKGRVQYHLCHSSNSYKRMNTLELLRAYIMNDTIDIMIKDPFRWFGFVNQLKKNNDCFDDFVNYRNRMVDYYIKVGADNIVYFADQGVTELIMDKMMENDWIDMIKYIKSQEYYFDYININSFDKQRKIFAEKAFNERHEALQISISDFFLNNRPFYEESENLQILFDDFKDI